MGTDMWVTLGRVKRQPKVEESKSMELSLLKDEVRFGDIILQKCVQELQPKRNYHLFSFLGDSYYGLCTKPLVDPEKLSEQTEIFLEWLTDEAVKDARSKGVFPKPPICVTSLHERLEYDKDDFNEEYGLMDWIGRRFFYPVETLLAFDYTQPAIIGEKYADDGRLFPDPKGRTYMQLFEQENPSGWVKLLKMLQEEKWDFVIFTFNN